MFTPPAEVEAVCAAFAPLFTRPSWRRAQALLCGVLLAPANHALTAALRALGLADDARFQNYHRLLNRVRWSARAAAGVLLRLLVATFAPTGPLILSLDETVERRRGPQICASQIVGRFVRRWAMEVTFQEARAHLGVEGQRQWNDLAVTRATPLRLALFSLVTLIVQGQPAWQTSVRQAAWYKKALPTFSDALAQVRRCLWRQLAFCMSEENIDSRKPPASLFAHFGELLAHAA